MVVIKNKYGYKINNLSTGNFESERDYTATRIRYKEWFFFNSVKSGGSIHSKLRNKRRETLQLTTSITISPKEEKRKKQLKNLNISPQALNTLTKNKIKW